MNANSSLFVFHSDADVSSSIKLEDPIDQTSLRFRSQTYLDHLYVTSSPSFIQMMVEAANILKRFAK